MTTVMAEVCRRARATFRQQVHQYVKALDIDCGQRPVPGTLWQGGCLNQNAIVEARQLIELCGFAALVFVAVTLAIDLWSLFRRRELPIRIPLECSPNVKARREEVKTPPADKQHPKAA